MPSGYDSTGESGCKNQKFMDTLRGNILYGSIDPTQNPRAKTSSGLIGEWTH